MAKLPPFFRRGDANEPSLPTHAHKSHRASTQSPDSQAPNTSQPLSAPSKTVREPYSMKHRPTFLQWLRISMWDIITLLVLGAIALAVFSQPPAAYRTFPVTFKQDAKPVGQGDAHAAGSAGSGDVVWPEYAYPYREQIIPSYADSLLALGVPILVIIVAQVRVWSFWDLNNGILGVIQSVLSGTVFQVIIKCLVGGLRPHFLDVCKPDTALASMPGGNSSGLEGTGFGGMFYTRNICTDQNTDGIDNALESFPSGHTTAAFAGFVFLSLYLNAKLKVFSNHQPALWKLAVTWAPLLVATLIAGSLTIDQTHNWYDIVAGGVIGIMMAFASYRVMYASVWDWRTNHIPLHRDKAFVYAEDCDGAGWTVTRAAGWSSGRSVRRKARRLVSRPKAEEQNGADSIV